MPLLPHLLAAISTILARDNKNDCDIIKHMMLQSVRTMTALSQ